MARAARPDQPVSAQRSLARAYRAWLLCGAATLAASSAVPAQPPGTTAQSPWTIVDQTQRAVGTDTLLRMVAGWRATLARDPSDKPARFGLGMVASLNGDTATADRTFDRLIAEATPADPIGARFGAYAQLGRAMVATGVGRWLDAAREFAGAGDAMRAVNDSAGEANSLVSLAWLETRLHRPTALAHLARADSLIAPSEPALRGAWDCVHAAVLSAANAPGAIAAADTGAALARRGGQLRLAASCEFAAATDLASHGGVEAALPRLSQVVALSERTQDYATNAAALQWRGFAELNLGYYGRAEADLLAAAVEGSAHGSLAAVGWSELNLASLAEELGDIAGARRHAARSYAALAAIKDSAGLGILRRGVARWALAAGDTAAARTAAVDALQAAEHHGRIEDIAGDRTQLAAVDVQEGRWDDALHELETLRSLLAENHAPGWSLLLPWDEARVHLDRGDPATALRQLERATLVLDSAQHLFRYEIQADRAVALLRLGDTSRALAALQQADDQVDAWRATLDDAGLRVLAFAANEQIPGPPANAEVIAAAVASHRAATAFALAERQRARELTDQLLRAQALGSGKPHVVRLAARVQGRGADATVDLAALERALPDDSTALVEYVTGEGLARTSILAVSRHHVAAVLAPPVDSLEPTIDRLDALVDQGVPAGAAEREIGAVLLPAALGLPGTIRRLVVVPDGALHRVPFMALRLADGTPVVVRYAVSLAPSATAVVALWQRPVTVHTASVLAFGDPVLPQETRALAGGAAFDRGAAGGETPTPAPRADPDDTTARSALAVSSVAALGPDSDTTAGGERAADSFASGGLPRLRWTADEATLVGAFAREATVRLRQDASAAFLETAPLEGFSILHFATHAIVDEDVPARSALALAPGDGQSGYIGPSDLAALRLAANLVVLSACRTARGAVVTGEGVRGLTGPLLAAGAHSVLATQWRLNDRDAVPLVYTLYREMAAGLPVVEAVRRTALAARAAGRPEREWAAFILVGDPMMRVPLETPPPDRVPAWVRPYPDVRATANGATSRTDSPGTPQTSIATARR